VQEVRYIQNEQVGVQLKYALQLLYPSDVVFVRVQDDRPALVHFLEGLMQLDAHVRKCV
jgi:hypothetical protein